MSEPPAGSFGALTAFQVAVARLFFTLPESAGFLPAGGSALVAQRLTNRKTQDLDFFASPGSGDVEGDRRVDLRRDPGSLVAWVRRSMAVAV